MFALERNMKTDMDGLVVSMGAMRVAKGARKPFRFFNLPYELRLHILELALLVPKTIDLDPSNIFTIRPLLNLLLVDRRMHDEAFRVFYGRNTFRVFPLHGRFFHTKKPLLARLSPRYRAVITTLELRLGPGWTKPPRGMVVNDVLRLVDAVRVRRLDVFLECDPASDEVYEGFRKGKDFFTDFCVCLIRDLFAQVPSLVDVEFDGYRHLKEASSPLLQALVSETKGHGKRILWGRESGWHGTVEESLASGLGTLSLGQA